jgi:hypothetical protein
VAIAPPPVSVAISFSTRPSNHFYAAVHCSEVSRDVSGEFDPNGFDVLQKPGASSAYIIRPASRISGLRHLTTELLFVWHIVAFKVESSPASMEFWLSECLGRKILEQVAAQ